MIRQERLFNDMFVFHNFRIKKFLHNDKPLSKNGLIANQRVAESKKIICKAAQELSLNRILKMKIHILCYSS